MIESVIAVGVLSIAIPLVFGALAETGKSGANARAETSSTWIIPACMEEIIASREGRSSYFEATTAGQEFPPDGEFWALAFSPEGKPVGRISKAVYERGLKELAGKRVRYVGLMASYPAPQTGGFQPLLGLRISLEHPSAAAAHARSKLEFYSLIP